MIMNRSRKDGNENELVLKTKVKDLEAEVVRLKQRLEDLRKAKNNTVVKREREVIQVGGPGLGRPVGVETAKYRELERQFAASEQKRKDLEKEAMEKVRIAEEDKEKWRKKCEKLEQDLLNFKESSTLELEKMRSNVREQGARADDANNELEKLRERLEVKAMQEENKKSENSARESYITDLINENTSLRMKEEALMNQLSEKEARWLTNKEDVARKIQEKWDRKYAQWMSDTERKIEELREANLVLKACLQKKESRPNEGSSSQPDG